MADLARFVAVVCGPALAMVARVIDSPDDRRERAQLAELNRLRGQFEGPAADSCLPPDRVPTTEKAEIDTCEEMT